MGWKDILVFADGSDNGLARVRMAAELAVGQAASLEVCVPACLSRLSTSAGVDFTIEVHDEEERLVRDDATRASIEIRTFLPTLAGRLIVETPEAFLDEMPALAARLAHTCDIVVVGQPIAEDASRLDDALLEGALMRSGRPCLMFPRWNEPRTWGRRVLVGWKDCREAARAVHDALPLLQQADIVRLFHRQEDKETERHTGLSRLAKHLNRYGVKLEEPRHRSGAASGSPILDEATAWDADLIVMGGYGRSAFRERMLGGATRSAIRSSRFPVLFSH
jgi:nucleotide-binding universal stress UspA family protein